MYNIIYLFPHRHTLLQYRPRKKLFSASNGWSISCLYLLRTWETAFSRSISFFSLYPCHLTNTSVCVFPYFSFYHLLLYLFINPLNSWFIKRFVNGFFYFNNDFVYWLFTDVKSSVNNEDLLSPFFIVLSPCAQFQTIWHNLPLLFRIVCAVYIFCSF